jgi:hypothetical protein
MQGDRRSAGDVRAALDLLWGIILVLHLNKQNAVAAALPLAMEVDNCRVGNMSSPFAAAGKEINVS